MQLIVVLGASKIRQVKFDATAFGQKDLSNFDKANVFIFGKQNGSDGVPEYDNLQVGHDKNTFFPKRLRPSDPERPACSIALHGNQRVGFSQAYSPTTSTSLGVYDAIPINVNVLARDSDGKQEESRIGISVANYKQGNKWTKKQSKYFEEGDLVDLHFKKGDYIEQDKDPGRTAGDIRRQTLEAIDFSSTYLLGNAKFKLASFVRNRGIEKSTVKLRLKCVERGVRPTTDYDRTEPTDEDKDLKKSAETALAILRNEQEIIEGIEPFSARGVAATPDTLRYSQSDEGDIDEEFSVKSKKPYPVIDISYKGTQKVTWIPEFKIKDDDGKVVDTFKLEKESYTFPLGGSIEHTQHLRGDVREELILKVDDVRKEIRRAKKDLEDLIDDIKSGDFDGDDLPLGANGYGLGYYGRDPKEKETENIVHVIDGAGIKKHVIDQGFKPNFETYDIKIQGKFSPYNGNDTDIVHFTFIYIDRHKNYHYFNFNGIYKSDGSRFFKRDPKLKDKIRPRIKQLKKTRHARRNRPFRRLESVEEALEERRDKAKKRVDRNFSRMHRKAIKIIRDDIEHLERIKDQLPSRDQDDRVGIKAVKSSMKQVIKSKKADLLTLDDLITNWDDYVKALDNSFFSKCLVKAEGAAYETLSECDVVKFSLKTKLFRRISGRQKKYGKEKVKAYSESDNGVKSRMAFFRIFYKRHNDAGGFKCAPVVYAVRHGSDADFYTEVTFKGYTRDKWSFKFEPVHDMAAEYKLRPFTEYAFLEETDKDPKKRDTAEKHTFSWTGRTVDADPTRAYYPDENERGPIRTNEWDMFSVNSDTQVQFSFESGPELALTAVTEQQLDATFKDHRRYYRGLTMMALGVFANRGLQDLRSISTLVQKGKRSYAVNATTAALEYHENSTSYAPDIFLDTLLDKTNGVGKYVTSQNVDMESVALAKKFCINNNLPRQGSGSKIQMFMDGIIADKTSWREFWINVAPFSLLELARKNGKETLVPALPVNSSGQACDTNGVPTEVPISALFTAGNILEGSYKEEFLNYGASTEDLIATVIYRDFQPGAIFSQNRSVDVRLSGVTDETAIRETFDLSQFVSQKEQAIMFGKLLCNQRRYITKGIEFQTFPSEAMVEPGAFIYVDIGLNNWDKYTSGLVMPGGKLNTPVGDQKAGTFNFLLYKPATGAIKKLSNIAVTRSGGISTAADLAADYVGWMFVMGKDKPSKRVYRVTEVALEEEGELSIKAIEYSCFEEGGSTRAHVADFRSSNFEVS